MLGMLEGSGYQKSGHGSAAEIQYLAEVMRRYYADRSKYLGDPDFAKMPLTGLLDPAYIQRAGTASIRTGPRPARKYFPAYRPAAKAPKPRTSTSWTRRGTRSR